MKTIAALILALAAASAAAAPFAAGNAEAGKKLFGHYDCNSCHKAKVGGDGSAIFTRPDRIVNNPQQMLDRMKMCSGAIGADLTPQQEQDLGAYLNQTYYHFK